jgi:hypothetical protein
VTNVEDLYNVFIDGEEYAIDVRFPSVKKLPDLKGKACVLGSERTPFRELGQRGEGII